MQRAALHPAARPRSWGRLVTEQGPLAPHDAPHRGLPEPSTRLLPRASLLSCSPGAWQQHQSVGRSQLSTSEPMVDQHGDPAARGSWLEGGMEQAQPVSQRSQSGGGRRRQKLSGNPWKGSRWRGSWRGWRWRSRGCRLADTWRVCCSAPRQLISMNAIVVAPPPTPPLPHSGLLRGRGRTNGICSQAALASPLSSKACWQLPRRC